jgi:hypothetical protein
MYSDKKNVYRPIWEQIAGGSFDEARMCGMGETIAMVVPHPTAFGNTDDEWRRFGKTLRDRSTP